MLLGGGDLMHLPKKIIHYPLLFFALTALTGVWMRVYLMSDSVQFIPYTHLLHGHSHIAILGWTFLAVFILFLKVTWEQLEAKKQAIRIVYATLFITTMMFFAFLYEGYALYSIILSTIHIFIEYWVIIFVFIAVKKMPNILKESRYFIYASLISLFLSTLGPFSLGAIAAKGLRDSAFFDMAIYFYLHFQYNGWLFLFLIGLFLFHLYKKGIVLNGKLVTTSFWIYFIALFPGFCLSILWFELGLAGIICAVIGAIGQLIGIILLFVALLQKRKQWMGIFSFHMNMSYLFTFIILLSKNVMELGLLYLPFADVIYDTRSVVVGYLHLTLLGFVSVFILNMYQSTSLLDEGKFAVKNGIAIFLGGFVINEVVLFSSGLFSWINWPAFPYQNSFLFVASVLMFGGILVIWSSLITIKRL